MNKTQKLLILLNVLLGLLLLYIIFLLIYPFQVLEFKDDRFPVMNKQVVQGSSLTFISRYCKYVDSPSTVSRSFINDFAYATTPTITFAKKGCHTMRVVVPIPEELPDGKYYLHNKFVYQVNPLRTITLVHDSEEFEVKEVK